MIQHIKDEIKQHLFILKNRPNTEKHFVNSLANELLDMIEGFDMLPPPVGVGEEDEYGFLDYEFKWEPEDE